ncbi:hypothetical protein KEM48_008869 [Puccinia striiformis f. sp. tritici PST-130]|nr:hypothetical protein Pst134EB_021941 [Puccinia striiformis f. sp. tritici]KAI9599655.1 hypothetical protein KEM48_008869 [Puccinia striiformis f. sp. tritici PST-130]KAI9614858.1 hypothetical protein H4Q26_009256 [Puccinia striiformis f. sp. tritici PST-130]
MSRSKPTTREISKPQSKQTNQPSPTTKRKKIVIMASKPRLFAASKKGKNYKPWADLNSQYADQRKDSIK